MTNAHWLKMARAPYCQRLEDRFLTEDKTDAILEYQEKIWTSRKTKLNNLQYTENPSKQENKAIINFKESFKNYTGREK